MLSSTFGYNKNKVIQALRYHFISRREIKLLMIFVNVFAIGSAALFFFKQITPIAFLISSLLWFALMIMFWFLLPRIIYKKERTFKDNFRARVDDNGFGIENDRGQRNWQWKEFSEWMESPHFFHLYFNSSSFFIIPKEAFDGDEEHAARKIISAHIKKA
ncbi:MAG: YcxB family protein [Sphingobacteriales bacterium]|nr:MAG: YcxB family protein [Sphingobacteriales bacterium]